MRPLDTLCGAPVETGRFLLLAVGITAALAELHGRNVINKYIEPRNIIIDPETSAVTLTGFTADSLLPQEYQAGTSPWNIEATPAYMSPEQTGRTNRAVDYRTDLYSLGVTFYEMLTGTLPFQAGDIMEWVHCHIARTARPPTEVIPEIPAMLSDIVMKLLAKDPEERYQTASGLRYDLEKCLDQWKTGKEIEQFPLGEWDISEQLLIPQKLYGRERDINTLLSAFDRVVESGIPELVMVSGYSGIGKTSLVREVYGPVVRERGFFISGKFDQYKRDVPYSTIAEAFREMIRQILTESEERIGAWKRRIQEALGINGQLIVDIIPQAELIIGPQPPVAELPPTETQNRFNMFFRRFVSVFAGKEHPLVIFLDDLQWVDSAGLKLLEYIITHPDTRDLLLIGAYRDNEVGPSHPLMSTLDNIRKQQTILRTIVLSPLSFEDLSHLMADTFRSDRVRVEPLTRLVHEKTACNPFFVIQFLKTLKNEGLVEFDRTERLWSWDIAGIRAKGYTDNVVDLMVGKLRKLSAGTLQKMRLAACIGHGFALRTLALISGMPQEKTRDALVEAIREGLLLCWNDDYSFLHDRVQEAAYSLIPPERRAEVHLKIGRYLMSQLPETEIAAQVFDIVSQLNCGVGLITSRRERERVAELNLVAGKRAKGSTAYVSALSYLAAGTALLAEDSWDSQYNLTFELQFHRAECEFLTGNLTIAEERLSMLWRRAGNLTHLAAVTCLSLDLYTTLDQSDRGIEVCLAYLRRVGIEWSPHPTKDKVREEYERIWRQLGSRPIQDLIDLPPMTDPDWRVTMDVLTALMPAALFTDENLLCLSIGRMANLSLEHGHCDGSSLAYVWLGMILGPYFGDFRAAFRFGKLGLDLVERGLDRFKARVYLCFANFVNPWAKHIRTSRELQRRAFDTATRIGDLTFAAYSCNSLITNLLASGEPLADVQREAEARLVLGREMGFGLFVDIVTTQLRLVRTLRGLTPSFSSFNDEEFDEGSFEVHLEEDPRLAIGACWYWIRKLQACFHAGDFASALEAAAKAEPLLWTSPAFFEVAEYHFYAGLALAAHCDEASPDGRAALASHQKQLGLWAENCPENFLNRYALVSAEVARIEGRELDAERLYEEAIRSARVNGFIQNEGISNEVAARFYRARGFETTADAYLRHARTCYVRWGADGKVKQLDEQYPKLQEEERAAAGGGIGGVDALAVVKASQAISGEILLSNLLETLMRMVIENAGARKGYLLLVRGEELSVEAQARVQGEEIKVLLEAPSRKVSVLPESMVNYVRRTRESVILDDAAEDTVFSTDEYIIRNKPVSVLCMPVLRQSNLIGLLYLENDIVKGAFTPARIAVLEVLAAQAAISLENSTLYAALDESRRLLQSIIDNSAAVIYVKDLEGRYLLINRRFEELFHVAREAAAGKTDYDLFPKARADAFRAFDRRVLSAGRALDSEEAVPHDDGLHTYISIKAPLYNAAGMVYAVCGISADITERKRAEEALQKAHEELEQKVVERTKELSAANMKLQELDRLKSMFIATMSHELRTPLNSVIGYSSILMDEWVGPLNEEQKDSLAAVMRSGKHLLALINDVIDVSKIEAGMVEPEIVEFDVAEVLSEAAVTFAREIRDKGLALQVESVHQTLRADRRRLLQCILNLVSNAVKFTEQGSVRLSVHAVEGEVEMTVTDTGIGISEEELPRLFAPFVRLESPGRPKILGTGLGLYLTKKLVTEVLKGEVAVISRAGEGSIFSIRMPAAIN